MKKHKLSLDELRIKSFVTEPGKDFAKTLKGGTGSLNNQNCDSDECTETCGSDPSSLVNCPPRTTLNDCQAPTNPPVCNAETSPEECGGFAPG